MSENQRLHRNIRWLRSAQRVAGWLTTASIVGLFATGLLGLVDWGFAGQASAITWTICMLAVFGMICAVSVILMAQRWEILWCKTDEAYAIAQMSPAARYFHTIHPNEYRGTSILSLRQAWLDLSKTERLAR